MSSSAKQVLSSETKFLFIHKKNTVSTYTFCVLIGQTLLQAFLLALNCCDSCLVKALTIQMSNLVEKRNAFVFHALRTSCGG